MKERTIVEGIACGWWVVRIVAGDGGGGGGVVELEFAI